jgi:hypothetical protein
MERYEIRVVGHLDGRRVRALGCGELRRLPSGESIVIFAALDQAALHGLLARLRDAGLGLASVRRLETVRPRQVDRPATAR